MPIIHSDFGDIYYSRQGSGPVLMIALHGYGDDHTIFQSFQHIQQYTLLAIDLPFHGNTHWNKATYQAQELKDIIQQLLIIEAQQSFIAVGHSLGGRLWLSLLPHFTPQIQRLHLLAPDGINTQGMALIDWMPLSLKIWASKLLKHPNTVLKLADFLKNIKLLDLFSYRYLKYQLLDQDRLNSMQCTWYSLSYFPMCRREAVENILSTDIPTTLYLGNRDKIVPAKPLRTAFEGISQVNIIAYESTHRGLVEKYLVMLE